MSRELHRAFTVSTEDGRKPRDVTFRVWHGPRVIAVFTVGPDGGFTCDGNASPLEAAQEIDVEIDPWAGAIRANQLVKLGYVSIVDFLPDDSEPPF